VQESGGEPPPRTLKLKCVEKPCDLAPCCNAERSLFVLFPQRFLPNSTLKGLRNPKENSFKKQILFICSVRLLDKRNKILQNSW